jgi:hypothetical protein
LVVLDQVTPAVYEKNPFRLLGLSVVAGLRDVAKRIDELKLAAEFGIAQADWSFGPEQALSGEQIRAAAQHLKEPVERLLWELFWLWPENYPEEEGGDEAMGYVTRGETHQAIEYWQGAAMQGRLVPLHNMAVYYHMEALRLEAQDDPPQEDLVQLWFKALRFWEKVSVNEEFWERLQARVKKLGDARVTGSLVQHLRNSWSEMLARICASLALDRARRGLANRAALHAALVTHIHGDTPDARRMLQECAAPIARRIDSKIIEYKNRLARAEVPLLAETWALLHQCSEDLSMIELLCGRGSDYFVEISDGLADVALDGVVGYQRQTQDDFACLPLLVCLQDVQVLPELKSRIKETFDAVFGNALVREERPAVMSADGHALAASDDARVLSLMANHIIPAVETLGLGAHVRERYASRVANMLADMAVAAGMERDDMETAMKMFELALGLPVSEGVRAGFEARQAQLQKDFETRREKELQVEAEAARLVINRHGICLNDQWVTSVEVAGLRHGYVPGPDGSAEGGSFVISWYSYSGAEYELNSSNLLPPSSYVEEHYNRIVDSIYFFIVPGLVERIANDIRAGHDVRLGNTPLSPEGMPLPVPAVLFWLKDEPISYHRLQTSIEGGRLIVSSKDNPRQSESHDVALVWNAAVFGSVVEALIR